MRANCLFSRQICAVLFALNRNSTCSCSNSNRYSFSTASWCSSLFYSEGNVNFLSECPDFWNRSRRFQRNLHSSSESDGRCSDIVRNSEQSEDGEMNEFLSRFVWIMRGKLCEEYPTSEKRTIDGMLVVIASKVVEEMEKGGLEQIPGPIMPTFSDDLWRTVLEVSNAVLDDMKKERQKEKLRFFLQSDEVKEMCRFACQIGVRGEMLRKLQFKWAKEKMDESEFYQNLERTRDEILTREQMEKSTQDSGVRNSVSSGAESEIIEEKHKVVSLPKRHGKIKYTIYGLDLSGSYWGEVLNKIHNAEEIIWPQEAKPLTGKCKVLTERIISLNAEEDYSSLLAEWVEHLQPGRVDWMSLLDRMKEQNSSLYLKVAEHILSEDSFHATVRDHCLLVDAHANMNHIEDAERILSKMREKGMVPDILTSTNLVHMYCKCGNLDRAKEAFENLKRYGIQPDSKVHESMIMAYVNAHQPKLGEPLMRDMEARGITPLKDTYLALLRSFALQGDIGGTKRIAISMHFAGFHPSVESCALLVETCGRAGDSDEARNNFDQVIKAGHKPDDNCIASMIAAYEKKNLLDKALNLLLQLEKDGIEVGMATYTVLVDWLGKLQLVEEAEQLLGRFAEKREAPPLKVHVSLCDMYSRAGFKKKALQALGVLEFKQDKLCAEDFERIIGGLIDGGFVEDAKRMHGLMLGQGFTASASIEVGLRTMMTSEALSRRIPNRSFRT